jgi:tetratricopeptide (TPR) repeat protein
MPKSSKDRQNPDAAGSAARLDGWKDIAAYLGKTDRTVKRWEAERGLPIVRVPGRGRGSVYAYPAELDEWLKSSSAVDEENSDAGEAQDRSGALDVDPAGAAILHSAAGAEDASPGQPAQSGRVRSGFGRRWAIAIGALLLCALALAALRNPGFPTWFRARSLLGKSPGGPVSAPPMAVSEADRALAHELYLKGRYEWMQRTPQSLNLALDYFTQAVLHDPGYAQAYVGLADTYDLLREYSTMPDQEAFSRAIVAARRAVELDDSLAEAHRALAYAEMYGSWDFADAEKEFRRAIQLNPNDPEARRWYANAFAVPGRYGETLAQIEKARELEPGSHATMADKGIMLYNAGKAEEAIATLKEVEQSAPQFRSPHVYLMMIDLDRRDYPAYLAEGEMNAEALNDPALKDIIASARMGYARDGGRGLLEDLYAKQREYYAAGKFSATTLAKTCVVMGKMQEALDLLEEAYAHREAEMLSCMSSPTLLMLKDEPRYKVLVKRINFPIPPAA